MEVFLTGGTGFIGKHLARSILNRGWSLTVPTRRPSSTDAQILREMGARVIEGDVTQPESLREDMRGADILIHNAAIYELGLGPEMKKLMEAVNVDGTENVLNLAQELEIPRRVHVASVAVFGNTGKVMRDETYQRQEPITSAYERTKTESYHIAQSHQEQGEPVIIVNPGPVTGVNDHSTFGYGVRMVINRVLPPVAWSPDAVKSNVEVRDVAEGIALAAEKGRIGETYLLTGEPQTVREIFASWNVTPRVWLPIPVALPIFALLAPLQRLLGMPAILSRETVRTVAMDMAYSSQKAQQELGWTYKPANQIWDEVIEGEIALLEQREGQNLLQRLKPLEGVMYE